MDIIGFVLIGISLIVSLIGVLILVAYLLSVINCRMKVMATVSEIIEKKSYYRGTTLREFTPVFTYIVNGKKYSAKADAPTSNPNKFAVGQNVTIFTDSNHPEKIRYGSNIGFLITGLVMLALGMLGTIFFAILLFMA